LDNYYIGGDISLGKTQKYPSGYRFPPELNDLLTDRAARMGISKNALLIQVLWDFFENGGTSEHRASKTVVG
jgi:hypothetical protein